MSENILIHSRFARVFGYNTFIVRSWWEHMKFKSFIEARTFFEENEELIQAKPFIKWV